MTLFGPDGSHWQAGISVPADHWAQVHFVIWRASIGTRTDATWPWAQQNAIAAGKALCAYHFVYPRGRYNPDAQAQTFHRAVGDTTIPCMLDWESDGSLSPDWDDVLAVAGAIRRLGHKVGLVYTGKWYWKLKGSPTMAGYGLDMVNAHYGSNPPGLPLEVYTLRGGDGGAGWYGYGGLDPVIWQYGSRVSFGTHSVAMPLGAATEDDDPARPSRVEPGHQPGMLLRLKRRFAGPLTAGTVAMDMNAIRTARTELHRWFHDPAFVPPKPPAPKPPTPTPTPVPPMPGPFPDLGEDDDDMPAVILQASDDPKGPFFWWNGRKIGVVRAFTTQLNVGRITKLYANPSNEPLRNFSKAQLRAIIQSGWDDANDPPTGYA